MNEEMKIMSKYLPYGLLVQGQTFKSTFELGGIDGEVALLVGYGRCDSFDIKPIFRPMSDLYKTIQIEDGFYIPIELLKKISDDDGLSIKYSDDNITFVSMFEGEMSNDGGYTFEKTEQPVYKQYKLIQKLFEWHFDVFGLIDKGLAIDINTLESVE